MCGITGIIGEGADHQQELLVQMTRLIAHRGPDDEGFWTGKQAALGHRRLSILDLSTAGHQPMLSADGRLVISYNGEIYNFLELRDELKTLGHQFRTNSDTEVLLAAYSQWGAACLPRLNGMFAFAIWDTHRRALFAARDRFGKKPFHYAIVQGRLCFASELKALLAVPGLTRTLNLHALTDFLGERISDHGSSTFIREISQLEAGHSLQFENGTLKTAPYWSLSEQAKTTADEGRISELLTDAVRVRLRADTPLGCLVSGGLDSSTIACLMRGLSPSTRLHLFTTQTDPPNEEGKSVASIVQLGGFELHSHTPTARLFWDDLPALLWHQEQPFGDASMAAHFALMREAKKARVPVLLSGQGADEIFAGYTTYLWVHLGTQLRAGKLRAVASDLRAVCRRQRIGVEHALAHVAFHALPRRIRGEARRAAARHRLSWVNRAALQPLSPRELHYEQQDDDLNAYLRASSAAWTLPGFLHYEDRNSMAFGVETRLPYLDYRLAEFVSSMPAEAKLHDGETKRLLRAVARTIVPSEIVERQWKQGYPAPLARWLRELEPEVRALVRSQRFMQNPLLDYKVWTRSVDAFLAGNDRALDTVWRGLVSAEWYSRVFSVSDAELRQRAELAQIRSAATA